METVVVKEPGEYGPIHPELAPKQGLTRFLTVADIYGFVFVVLFLGIVVFIAWAVNRHVRGIAEDVKTIKQEVVSIQPVTFKQRFSDDVEQLIKEARAFNETLKVSTRAIDTMSLKVGALDYSLNGLESAVGGVENQLMQVKPAPVVRVVKPVQKKVKVSAPLTPGSRLNGTNNPVP